MATRNPSILRGVPALLLLIPLVAGCTGGLAPEPEPPPPEVNATGPLSLDEGDIAGTLDGGDLLVQVVLRREGEGRIAGRVLAALEPLDGSAGTSGAASYAFDQGAETVVVRMPAPAGVDDPQKQAAVVIRYRVESNVGTLTGLRSLFVVMPKGQVVLLGPKTYLQGETTRVKLFARDPVGGKPLAQQAVTLKAALTVDEAGGPRVVEQTLPVTTDALGAATVDLGFQDAGRLALTASATAPGGTSVEAVTTADVVRLRRVLVTTDKPLYQPGHDMHLRVLALRKPWLHPDAGAEVLLEVLDAKGNKVFKSRTTASDFGIASAHLKIASEVNMGTWKVKATVGDTVTEKAVTVDRYSLPKFKLDLALDHPWYLVGGTVKGTVSARYFFGKAVEGGSVKIVFSAFDVEFSDFATVTGTTDAEGLYPFQVTLPGYLVGQTLEQGKALVRAALEVTDAAGQVVRKDAALLVAQAPLDVLLIPESGTLVPGVENQVYVFVDDPTGAPVAADVTVKFGEAATPVVVKTDASGVGSFLVTPEGEAVMVEAAAVDAAGATVTKQFLLAPGVAGEAVLVRTDLALYRVGETAQVTILAPDAKDRVYLDVLRQGRVVREEALDLKDGRATAQVDLDGEMSGDLVFAAYYMSARGRILRDEKVVFVQGADALTVAVTPDRETYAPADQASVGLKVTRGTTGEPVVAALGVQVVDEAVYALSQNQPGLLRTYFEIEDAIREPKYEIHGAAFDLTGIVTEDPADPAEQAKRQKEAQAAFAALGSTGTVDQASSWDRDLQGAAAVMAPFYQRDRQRVLDFLGKMAEANQVNWDTVVPFLRDQKYFYDFFGNLYRFESADSYTVTMRSRGPDEREGTADDWSAQFQVWEALQRGWEDGEWNGGGGPQPGVQDASVAADVGASDPGAQPPTEGDKPRVRSWFPETLYVNPQVITDENGEAVLTFPIADSITEWRLSALANSADGRLGSVTKGLKVFQAFFTDVDLPRVLTRGDQVSFPVVVYNYLDTDQQVRLEVQAGPWAELGSDAAPTLTVPAGSVAGTHVTLTAKAVGWHGVTVTAIGTGGSDAVMRTVEVVPDGTEVRGSDQGRLTQPVSRVVTFPEEAIPGTPKLLVKVYPGVMAQVVEGLDSILQMPSGCFEQTTSTLWPDALVLQYAAASGKITPEIELKAREFVSQGYQRLLTFECTGGGFTWFGDPAPANLILSAMGVMEFGDIGSTMDIDETVVPRTAAFLRTKQAGDGSWHETQGSEFATVRYDDLMTTCFVGWALGGVGADAGNALSYIASHLTATSSTYALALCANALAVLEPSGATATRAFEDLAGRAVSEGDSVHWTAGVSDSQEWYGGGGAGTDLEATALAVLALLKAGRNPDLASGALGWMSSKKDSFGNWGTTHATILSLKAFVASLSSLTQDAVGTVTVGLNGVPEESLAVTADNADVFFQFDLSGRLDPLGPNAVDVRFDGTGTLMYQVVWSHFVPGAGGDPGTGPLEIQVAYDKTQMAVSDKVGVTATVKNVSDAVAPMVLVDLGLPPGFDLVPDLLVQAVADGVISKYETTDRQVMVYVDAIQPGEVLTLQYGLVARHPLKVQCPDSQASLYYDPTSAATATCAALEVK